MFATLLIPCWAALGLLSAAPPPATLERAEALAQGARTVQDLVAAETEYLRIMEGGGLDSRALLGLGRILMRRGQPGAALVACTEVIGLDPHGPEGAQALLLGATALDRTGDGPGALAFLQRAAEGFPDTAEGLEARRRLDILARHRLVRPPLASLGRHPEGRGDWLKTPTALTLDASGRLALYQDGLNQAFRLEGTDLVPVGPSLKDVRALAFSTEGRLGLLAPKIGLWLEGSATSVPLAGQPGGLASDGWHGFWVSDAKAGGLMHVGPEGAPRTLPAPAFAWLAPLPGGGVVGACEATRTLHYVDAAGQSRLTIPYGKELPAPFRQILALASDPEGHVAALVDGDYEGVVIWGPQGQVLRHATFKGLGISGRFRALVFDREGCLLLADRSGDQLFRLR